MTNQDQGPQPIKDSDNTSFLEHWQNGRIVLQKSANGKAFFYPRAFCPYTWSTELAEVESVGRGWIESYSLIFRPNHPAFLAKVPIILAEVRLREGPHLLARVFCKSTEDVRMGASVRAIGNEAVSEFPLPTFELDS